MCRLLAGDHLLDRDARVRGGVPVMSLRLLDVTELQTNSTPAESPSGYVAASYGSSHAQPEWMSPVMKSASVTWWSRMCWKTSRRSSV